MYFIVFVHGVAMGWGLIIMSDRNEHNCWQQNKNTYKQCMLTTSAPTYNNSKSRVYFPSPVSSPRVACSPPCLLIAPPLQPQDRSKKLSDRFFTQHLFLWLLNYPKNLMIRSWNQWDKYKGINKRQINRYNFLLLIFLLGGLHSSCRLFSPPISSNL